MRKAVWLWIDYVGIICSGDMLTSWTPHCLVCQWMFICIIYNNNYAVGTHVLVQCVCKGCMKLKPVSSRLLTGGN